MFLVDSTPEKRKLRLPTGYAILIVTEHLVFGQAYNGMAMYVHQPYNKYCQNSIRDNTISLACLSGGELAIAQYMSNPRRAGNMLSRSVSVGQF